MLARASGVAFLGLAFRRLALQGLALLGLAFLGAAGAVTGVAAAEDLDARLGALLATLHQELVRQDPGRAAARVAVANFTEEGLPWGTPLGAYLRERVGWLVQAGGLFRPAAVAQTRGISVTQVTGVDRPNAPEAMTRYYGSDVVIDGSYRREGDRVVLVLAAVDAEGRVLAQTRGDASMAAVPGAVAAAQVNAEHTSQLLGAFTQLGPREHGSWKVEVTTNRPGMGASFRQGEPIRYYITSTLEGYLSLFHVDADRNVVRIFPNRHQPDARIRAGVPVEVPGPGAPFQLTASPPFGLETTFAIVTPVPLDEKDFQAAAGGFATPVGGVPALVAATRGIRVQPTGPAPTPGAGSTPAAGAAPAPGPTPAGGASTGAAPGSTAARPAPGPVGPPSASSTATPASRPAGVPTSPPAEDRPIVWNSITILIRP
jgi:hypothetical protein